ncbi:hypothetical protein [Kitasatospora paranensis]|uniref:Uncharacterized protein n=1 Tax=Kitasatospora paranensis TaxID=258053 RepID=A0ABW2GA14_9ACTN
MAHKEIRREDRNQQEATEARPPADRSYGDSASDHTEPADGPDPRRPDTAAVKEGYDATAESTATARAPRTDTVQPPDDDPEE